MASYAARGVMALNRYALALGKKICGYVTTPESTVSRVEAFEGRPARTAGGRRLDAQGWLIEGFDLPVNLMLAVPARIVAGSLEDCLSALKHAPC